MEKLLNDFGDHVSRSLADIHDVPQAGFLAAKQMANVLQRTPMHLRSVRRENPLSDELEAALGLACQLDEPVSKFVPSFSKFADQLPWYRRAARGDVVFEHGYINAEVIGPKGIVLSPGFWRQKDEEWWAPGPGGYVYNVPDILHAMKSDADPLFAIWCLNLSPEI